MGSSSRAVESPPADPFEFPSLAAGSPAICVADDVISSGSLLPFCAPPAKISAGYRKLSKESDPNPDPVRRRRRRRRKNRWYVLAFGSVNKVPAGMEMKEIRIRQQRNASAEGKKGEEWWGPWKLLRSLSCKGVEVAGDCHRRIVL